MTKTLKINKSVIIRWTESGLLLSILFYGYYWLILASHYTNPNSEDLSLAIIPRDKGLLYSIRSLLIEYDGRYFTNLLHGVNPLAYNWLDGYKLMPIFSMLLCILSLYFLLRVIFQKKISRNLTFFMSAAFYLFHLILCPSLAHNLFWMVSSFPYLYPFPFIFLWVGFGILYLKSHNYLYKILFFIPSALCLIGAIGLNAMFLPLNLLLILSASIFLFIKFRTKIWEFIPLAIIGISCIIFFVTCPGPWVRMADLQADTNPGRFSEILSRATWEFIYFMFYCGIWNIITLAVSLLFALLFAKSNEFSKLRIKPLLVIFFSTSFLVVLYLMTFPFYLSMYENGFPYRIFNPIFLGFQIIILFGSIFLLAPLFNKYLPLYHLQIFSVITSFFLLILLLMKDANPVCTNHLAEIRTQYDLGIFEAYDREFKNRLELIENAKLNPDWKLAVFDTITDSPKIIYYAPDIYPNRENDYWNIAWEEYFKVDEVRLKGDSIYKPRINLNP